MALVHENGGHSKIVHSGYRTGEWDLHLVALREMLPYFAAASSKCYPYQLITLTFILCLLKDVIRSMLYADVVDNWAGMSIDLIIAEMLMRSIKSTGGLTQ